MSNKVNSFRAKFAELGRRRKEESQDRLEVSRELGSVVMQAATLLDVNDLAEKTCFIEGVCELAVWGDARVAVKAIETIPNKDIRQNVAYMACACAIGVWEQSPEAVHTILKSGLLESREIGKILSSAERLKRNTIKADPNGDTRVITQIIAGIPEILADRQTLERDQAKPKTEQATPPVSAAGDLRHVASMNVGRRPVSRGPNG